MTAESPITLRYRIRCGEPGLARFEGVRVQTADLQGFFYHSAFVPGVLVLRVLPRLTNADGLRPATKRLNLLPPPGVHRLLFPGSGSELLDLRDYQPGDPPRTIAWKASARRDRLITKLFESEVPVRCTLFVDTSSSVRVASGGGRALTGLIDIAAGVLQANAAARDLTGICLFDEAGVTVVRPDRSPAHMTRVLRLLADASTLEPTSARVDPEDLIPLAYAFAHEVYPELLRPEVNAMPVWLRWLATFPGYWRHRGRWFRYLYRRRLKFFLVCGSGLPLFFLLMNLLAACLAPTQVAVLVVYLTAIAGTVAVLAGLLFLLGTTAFGVRQRRLGRNVNALRLCSPFATASRRAASRRSWKTTTASRFCCNGFSPITGCRTHCRSMTARADTCSRLRRRFRFWPRLSYAPSAAATITNSSCFWPTSWSWTTASTRS